MYTSEQIDKAFHYFSNFKHEEFRQHQAETIKTIANSKLSVFALMASAGSGKSIIGATLVKLFKDGIYVCSSKFLQEQIQQDFLEFELLFGRANYKCLEKPKLSLTCADCIYKEPASHCKQYDKCMYRVQKNRVANHHLRCLNYPYFLSVNNYTSDGLFVNKPIVICDEADKLENELLNFINIVVTEAQVKKLGLNMPKYKTACKKGIPEWKDWAYDSLRKVQRKLRRLPETATQKEYEFLGGFRFKLNNFLKLVDETWLLEYKQNTKYGQRWSFMPTWITPEMTDKFFRNHCGKIVLMSAKLPPLEALSKKLGIPANEIDYLEVPSTWDKKNRSIKFIPTVAINVKTEQEELDTMKPVIAKIMKKHEHDKGLIHTSSYRLARFVMSMNDDRLVTHTPSDKIEAIERFKRSDKPLVMVSPSMERGVSLDDDWCRFIIILKALFLDLSNKQISTRMHSSEDGRLWYDAECIQNIEQACGRGVRHKDDWCHIYLLDKNIERLYDKQIKSFSRYFKDGIQW